MNVFEFFVYVLEFHEPCESVHVPVPTETSASSADMRHEPRVRYRSGSDRVHIEESESTPKLFLEALGDKSETQVGPLQNAFLHGDNTYPDCDNVRELHGCDEDMMTNSQLGIYDDDDRQKTTKDDNKIDDMSDDLKVQPKNVERERVCTDAVFEQEAVGNTDALDVDAICLSNEEETGSCDGSMDDAMEHQDNAEKDEDSNEDEENNEHNNVFGLDETEEQPMLENDESSDFNRMKQGEKMNVDEKKNSFDSGDVYFESEHDEHEAYDKRNISGLDASKGVENKNDDNGEPNRDSCEVS